MNDINKLTLEELTQLAKQDGRKHNKFPKKEYKSVINFIKDFNIQSGNIRVTSSIIFYLYKRQYNRYISREKVGRVSFFHTFAQHFTQKKSNGKRYYMLNNFIDFTDDLATRAENYKRSYNNVSKKKNKTSSSETSIEHKREN